MKLEEIFHEYSDLPEFLEVGSLGIDTVGNFGNTPLHVAACRGEVTAIGLLLSAGADVNKSGELGNTALHEAVGQGFYDAVDVLLLAGARVDVPNDFGDTALDWARKPGKEDILRQIEERAAK